MSDSADTRDDDDGRHDPFAEDLTDDDPNAPLPYLRRAMEPALSAAGVDSVEKIAALEPDSLAAITGMSPDKAAHTIAAARRRLAPSAQPDRADVSPMQRAKDALGSISPQQKKSAARMLSGLARRFLR